MTEKAEKYAKRYGTKEDWEDIQKRLPATWHTSGFSHNQLPVVTGSDDDKIQTFTWGYVPAWARDEKTKASVINRSLNTRAETMSENKIVKTAVDGRRCLVFIDGFFEHHTIDKKTKIPFHIYRKDQDPIAVAGLWRKDTVSILTCSANELMAKIHNQPAGSEDHRMPLIIDKENDEEWLHGSPDDIESLVKPYPSDLLTAHTCHRLSGKSYPGNVPEVIEEVEYDGFNLSLT